MKRFFLLSTLLTFALLIACNTTQKIEAKNTTTIEQVAVIEVESPAGLAWSPDSSLLYAYSYNAINQIDTSLQAITVQRSLPAGAFITDINGEKGLYVETTDNSTFDIKVIESGELMQSIAYPAYATTATLSPDGTYIAIASDEAWLVDIFDVETGGLMDTLIGFETAAPVYGVQYSRNGDSLLYFARAALQPQDIASHDMGIEIFHEDFISTFTSSPDGSEIATAAAGMYQDELTSLVYLWNRSDGSQLAAIPVAPYVTAMDYTPDGQLLVIAGGNMLYFAKTGSLELISTLETPHESIAAICVAPDGTLIAVAGSMGGITLWGIP